VIELPNGRALAEIQRGRVAPVESTHEREIENRDPKGKVTRG
jgi:hypothetical protein